MCEKIYHHLCKGNTLFLILCRRVQKFPAICFNENNQLIVTFITMLMWTFYYECLIKFDWFKLETYGWLVDTLLTFQPRSVGEYLSLTEICNFKVHYFRTFHFIYVTKNRQIEWYSKLRHAFWTICISQRLWIYVYSYNKP